MLERTIVAARMDARGRLSRRTFLRNVGTGGALASLGWHDLLLASANELRKRGKSVIVLWMQGGPSQFETFDPKPESQTKAIQTGVPGLAVADFWPNVARRMSDIALIRSMTNREGNHQRATYQMHTGYAPSGSVRHPSFGSLISQELSAPEFELPGFVSILGPSAGPGFLPVAYAPFRVQNPASMPANSQALVPAERYDRRLSLLGELERSYAEAGATRRVKDHQDLYGQASRLVKSPDLKAFDIDEENAKTRETYGATPFGQGCLLARCLVEAGVTYVEVQLGNWDTHFDNRDRTAELASVCDPAFAALVSDLKQRGLLADTVVLWMGEFGRTPRVNPRAGRDHYPRAFSVALAGGGIRGGQVLGRTSARGDEVVDRPVTVNDLFCTICRCVRVDPRKENLSPLGRPMKIVDGGRTVSELLGS